MNYQISISNSAVQIMNYRISILQGRPVASENGIARSHGTAHLPRRRRDQLRTAERCRTVAGASPKTTTGSAPSPIRCCTAERCRKGHRGRHRSVVRIRNGLRQRSGGRLTATHRLPSTAQRMARDAPTAFPGSVFPSRGRASMQSALLGRLGFRRIGHDRRRRRPCPAASGRCRW
jgi:hypothetical protein